jgi:hypothetical protein
MNESDASGLLGVGMHEMDWSQESYTTECSKMNQDTSAMYTDHSNASSFLEECNMSGIQPLEELRFGNTQHLELQSQVYKSFTACSGFTPLCLVHTFLLTFNHLASVREW